MKIGLSEMLEGFRIAFQTLKSNKLRSVLTTLGIFIGVIVVTVIISVIQGLNTYVKGELASLGVETVWISKWPWTDLSYEEYLKIRKRKKIDKTHLEYIEKYVTLADAVSPDIGTRANIGYRNETLERLVITGTSDGYMNTQNVAPVWGRFINEPDVEYRRSVCVIGYELVELLYENKDPIGKSIKIGPHQFLVVGVLEQRGKLFDFNLDQMVIVPYTTFLKYFGIRRSLDIQVKAKSPEILNELADQLTGLMRQARGLKVGQPDDFSVNQQGQIMETYNNLTRTLWIVLIGIGSISLLVGGIGIMNIMLVSVTERTREIGIRKALGAKRHIILWQFLVESMFISAIGVTLGILASIGLANLVRSISPLPVNISLWVLFLGIGFTVAIGTFFGLYPASKAARLDPIEALRYE